MHTSLNWSRIQLFFCVKSSGKKTIVYYCRSIITLTLATKAQIRLGKDLPQLLKIYSSLQIWLLQCKNFATAAIFGQKMPAWLQGRKKNFVRLPSDQKTLLGVILEILGSFGVILAFWPLSVSPKLDGIFLSAFRHFLLRQPRST